MLKAIKLSSSSSCWQGQCRRRNFGTILTEQRPVKPTGLVRMEYLGPQPFVQRQIKSVYFDTRHWDEFYEPQDGDVIVVTAMKSGTTLVQQICAELIYKGEVPAEGVAALSPWIALALPSEVIAQQMAAAQPPKPNGSGIGRRILKSHEPIESMPFYENVKYIFIGRDYRDIIWSWFNQNATVKDEFMHAMEDIPRDYEITPIDSCRGMTVHDFYRQAVSTPDDIGNPDGYPAFSPLSVIGSWLHCRSMQLPNVKYVHYNHLLRDLPQQMREIAAFIGEDVGDENTFASMVDHCSLDSMRASGTAAPMGGECFESGVKDFFFKGTNGRWKGTLTEEDIENYRTLARGRYLDEQGVHWLETGLWN